MTHWMRALPIVLACLAPASLPRRRSRPTSTSASSTARASRSPGLTAADFRVREDGVAPRSPEGGPATEPLTVALLVDDSQAATPALQMIREASTSSSTRSAARRRSRSSPSASGRPSCVDYTTDQKKLHDGGESDLSAIGRRRRTCSTRIVEVSKGLQKREAEAAGDRRPDDGGRRVQQPLLRAGARRARQESGAPCTSSPRPAECRIDRRDAQPQPGDRDRHRADRRTARSGARADRRRAER